jgi:hypothetical protein
MVIILLAAAILLTSVVPASAAGKWVLCWWREKGYYENCGGMCLVIHVYTFDENGNALGGVPIYTTWGTYMGVTEGPPKGWIEITEDVDNDRDVRIGDPATVDSDHTPVMSIHKYPQFGHYSYDCGFMYKADASNPGEFDTTMNCTVNLRDSTETDIPYTSSLIYYSAICSNWQSDQFWLWPEGGVCAQSFVVPAGINRIVGVKPQCAIGGTDQLQYTAEIHEGSITGPLVYAKTSYLIFPFQNWMWLPFGINNCPVNPGQTYFLVLRRYPSGSVNAYWCNNVYANGQAYENGTAYSDRDLFGMIVGASYTAVAAVTSPTLTAGWHLISLPLPPTDPSPATVFAGIPVSGNLFRWNPATQSYVTYQGTPVTGTQQISLPSAGWRLIGQPMDASTSLGSCTVTHVDSGLTQGYYTAAAAGWVSSHLWRYYSLTHSYQAVGADPWNAASSLDAWSGYWIWSGNFNLRLNIPGS